MGESISSGGPGIQAGEDETQSLFHGEDADGHCGFWSPLCAGRSGSISKPALNATTNAPG